MTKKEAAQLANAIYLATIKARSNIQETLEMAGLGEQVFAESEIFPILMGPKYQGILSAMQRVVDKGEAIEEIDIYNLCVLAMMEPAISAVSSIRGIDIPQPTSSLMFLTE